MPRTIIDLSTPTFQFNDQPLVHENIWRMANSIAQAPVQRQKLQMQMEEAAQEKEYRGLQMQKVKSDLEYEPTARAQRDKEHQMRLQNANDEIAARKADREISAEHDRQRVELGREKYAAQVETDNTKRTTRVDPRVTQLLKMGTEANIVPHPGESDQNYANRVNDTLAMQNNNKPSVSASMILPGMMQENAKSLTPRSAADIASEADAASMATTPRAQAGRAFAAEKKADPEGFNIPTLAEGIDPSLRSPPAPKPQAMSTDNKLPSRVGRELQTMRGRSVEEIKARMDVWKAKDPELYHALTLAAEKHLGLASTHPNMQNAMESTAPMRTPGTGNPGSEAVSRFAQGRY